MYFLNKKIAKKCINELGFYTYLVNFYGELKCINKFDFFENYGLRIRYNLITSYDLLICYSIIFLLCIVHTKILLENAADIILAVLLLIYGFLIMLMIIPIIGIIIQQLDLESYGTSSGFGKVLLVIILPFLTLTFFRSLQCVKLAKFNQSIYHALGLFPMLLIISVFAINFALGGNIKTASLSLIILYFVFLIFVPLYRKILRKMLSLPE